MPARLRRRPRWPLAAAVAGVLGVAAAWVVCRPVLPPAARGARVAFRLGCPACHGPGGTGGVPNPGSEDGEVPGWTGGTPMMFVKGEAEWAEWILDGAPRRERAEPRPPGLLQMPAYRGFLTDAELTNLIAYLKAVSGMARPAGGPPARGFAAASRLGCFGCHGPGGRTGSRNPRSLKGVIPPWEGSDFGDLVRDDAELRGWILDGGIPRLAGNPLARFFTGRQRIAMPAYRDVIKAGELEVLTAYLHWLRRPH